MEEKKSCLMFNYRGFSQRQQPHGPHKKTPTHSLLLHAFVFHFFLGAENASVEGAFL